MTMGKPQNKFRFERKYNLKEMDYPSLMYKIMSSELITHHPPRKINNLYLDTLSRESYFENVEGLSERNKYRIRWYGSRFGEIKPTLEVKIKKEYVNRKKSLKLPKFKLFNFEGIENLYSNVGELLQKQEHELFIPYSNIFPLLLNGYDREYFISKCGTTRLTIDKNLFFFNVRTKRNVHPLNRIIVEVKYATKNIPAIDFNDFELNLDKSSKFVLGVDLTK